jgi:hypothetical protein
MEIITPSKERREVKGGYLGMGGRVSREYRNTEKKGKKERETADITSEHEAGGMKNLLGGPARREAATEEI